MRWCFFPVPTYRCSSKGQRNRVAGAGIEAVAAVADHYDERTGHYRYLRHEPTLSLTFCVLPGFTPSQEPALTTLPLRRPSEGGPRA